MDFFNRFKNFWVNLNLIMKILIIFILFSLVISSFNLSGYVVYIMIISISGLGLFTGIKGRKKAQTILSSLFVVFVTMGLYFDIEDEKEYKRLEQAEAAVGNKEQEVSSIDKKTKKENNVSLDKENKKEVSVTGTTSIPVEKSMDTKIWNSIGSNESSNVLNVTYSDLGDDKVVVIKMALRENFTAADMLKSGFIDAKNIIKTVDSSYRSEITKYDFWFVGKVADSSGNSDIQKLLSFEYNRNKLNGIDLSTVILDDFIRQGENMWVHPVFNI